MEELKPKRQLNIPQTFSIIIGTVIGSGVFISLPIVAGIAGSPGLSVLIWLLGGILWLPPILVLAEMGTAYPEQGFGYTYLKKAGSPFLAFLYTWTSFLTSDTPTLTIVGLSAASVLTFFFPLLDIPLYARIFAAVLILSLTVIHYRSVRQGGNFQIILTIAKISPLIAVVVISFFFIGSGNLFFSPPQQFIEKGNLFLILTAGISATSWSYAGFGNILNMAGEVKDPKRTLPITLIGSVFFVMAAYTLISFGTSAIVPFSDITSAEGKFINPFSYLSFFREYAGGFFAIAAFISMVGVLNASIMAQPRLEYATARDGLFFEIFGRLHPKYLTPHYSILIQSLFATVLFLLGDLNNMLGYFTLSYVLQNMLVYASVFYLRRREDYKPSFKSPLWKLMGALSVIIQVYLAYGTIIAYPLSGVAASAMLIAIGFPVYWYFYKLSPRRKPS